MKKEWIKIGSKNSSFLARYNAVYKCVNHYMKKVSGIPTLLNNYKYIEHTHYASSSYFSELKLLYTTIHKKMGGIDGYINLRKKSYKESFRKIKEILLKANKNLSDEKLGNILLEADDVYAKANSFLGLGTLYTDFLSRELYKRFGKDYFYFDFSAKTKLSQYQDDLVKISKIKNRVTFNEKVNEILKKYYWIGSFFLIGNELNKRQILQDIDNIPKNRVRIRQKIKKLPSDSLIMEMKKLSRDRNEEIEEFMEIEYYFRQLLYKIAKRIRIDFKTIIYLSTDEVIDCLLNKSRIPNSNINKRKKLFGFLIKEGKATAYCGNEARFLIEDIRKDVTRLKGSVACYSEKKIRGIVKIINNSSDIKDVEKGDILVTVMTTPNYMQAIYKASAIVTDEGGVTCHAAIISRELNIPCIIGTKIATKVLKDGDLVEVDANKGIVKIIK